MGTVLTHMSDIVIDIQPEVAASSTLFCLLLWLTPLALLALFRNIDDK